MAKYKYVFENERYILYKNDSKMTTPAGNIVLTQYKDIAEKLVEDAAKYGFDFGASGNLLPWHFTILDNFSQMPHEQVERILTQSFLQWPDWTFEKEYDDEWKRLIGRWNTRKEQIIEWLSKCAHMQMTAACCIGNAYHSINLAFALAIIMEEKVGDERVQAFKKLADAMENVSFYGPASEIMKDFMNFNLYYGIILDEDGPIISGILSNYDESDDFELDELEGEPVTIEMLVGRNFYHYTNGVKDDKQPTPYSFPDVDLDIWDDEDEEDEDEDEEEIEAEESLSDYIPDNCWIKRFVDDKDSTLFYLVYIVESENEIEEIGCIEETTRLMGGGMFMFPGMETPNTKSWEEAYYIPDKVYTDLIMLRKKRILPQNFSFQGKKLPKSMIDAGGNGGSNTEYYCAIQSAERLAYMHLSIDTTEEGMMEDFSYSTYQSSGNSYNDMFTRPIGYSDREDEAKDILLYLLDQYTDDEYQQLLQ